LLANYHQDIMSLQNFELIRRIELKVRIVSSY